MHRSFWILATGLVLASVACHPVFQVSKFSSNEALYQASLRQFQRGKWDDAVTGFDHLTLELPVRDSLLPRSYWYLGQAYQHTKDHLLSAQAFGHLFESFPDDSLAPAAALRTAREYSALWPKPSLDPTYGETALASYGTLVQFYPNAPQADTGAKEAALLEDRFAQKDFNTGMSYLRDHAYDSALIYFRDVLGKYPETPTARRTALKMLEAFRAIHYAADAADLCTAMQQKYENDADVKRYCPAPATSLAPRDTTHPIRPIAR